MNAHTVLGHAYEATDAYDATLIEWAFRSDVMSERQLRLHDYWAAGSSEGGGFLAVTDFDPLAVWSCIGFLHILEYDRARDDFFYRVYGETAAGAAQAAMHRRWVSQHPGLAAARFQTHYRDIMKSRRPWLGEVFARDEVDVAPYWLRMVLPLSVPGDAEGFACVTLAEPQEVAPDRSTTTQHVASLDDELLDLVG